MGLFGKDRAAERSKDAAYTRKVARMHGPSDKVARGRSIPDAPAPHTCGQACRPGHTCTSTVRGGVCPCPWC